MYKVIRERHGKFYETWETLGHWAERANGETYWHVDSYIRCLKVEAA